MTDAYSSHIPRWHEYDGLVGWLKHQRGRRSTLWSEPEWSYIECNPLRDTVEYGIYAALREGKGMFSSARIKR